MPTLLDRTTEMEKFQEDTKGHIFDLEYSIEAVNRISKADATLDVYFFLLLVFCKLRS
jgi:hypothetical protein